MSWDHTVIPFDQESDAELRASSFEMDACHPQALLPRLFARLDRDRALVHIEDCGEQRDQGIVGGTVDRRRIQPHEHGIIACPGDDRFPRPRYHPDVEKYPVRRSLDHNRSIVS